MSYKNQHNDRKQDSNSISNVISEIDKLEKLKDMEPKDYADEEGYANQIAEHFSKGRGDSKKLNTNQLRKFFGAIRDIESKGRTWGKIEAQFYLLKPKLAVSVGRELIPKDFHKLMMKSMSKVDVGKDEEKIKSFDVLVNFLEAIVAYSKYHDSR
jgi:CRISPR-associated protein Csm2